jgi:hypothetical protein
MAFGFPNGLKRWLKPGFGILSGRRIVSQSSNTYDFANIPGNGPLSIQPVSSCNRLRTAANYSAVFHQFTPNNSGHSVNQHYKFDATSMPLLNLHL